MAAKHDLVAEIRLRIAEGKCGRKKRRGLAIGALDEHLVLRNAYVLASIALTAQ